MKISNTFMVQLTHRWIKKSECLEGLFKLLLYPLVKMSFSVVTGELFFFCKSCQILSERIFFRYSTVNKCTLNWMIMALLLKLFYKWAATWNNYCWLFFFCAPSLKSLQCEFVVAWDWFLILSFKSSRFWWNAKDGFKKRD